MKKFSIAILAILMAITFMGCWNNPVGPTPSPSLRLVTVKTLSGIRVVVDSPTPRCIIGGSYSNATFSSPNTEVAVVPEVPADLTGKVAMLNATTGLITPLGSAPAKFTVTASDGTNSGSIEVTTSIIDLAGSSGTTTWVAASANPPEMWLPSVQSLSLTFHGSAPDTELDHSSHGKSFKNKLNAGWVSASNMPAGMKRSWEVVDGQFLLYDIRMQRANSNSPWTEVPNTHGNLGAYDSGTIDTLAAIQGGDSIEWLATSGGASYTVEGNSLCMTLTNPSGWGINDANGNLITTATVTFQPSN